MKKIAAIFRSIISSFTPGKIPSKNIHVLMVVTSHDKLNHTNEKTGYYFSELTHPYHVFEKQGYHIIIASPKGGHAPAYAIDEKDPINRWFLNDKQAMYKVNHTLELSTINPKKYQAIYFAGGTGALWDFPENEALQKIADDIYQRDGIIAAVCHGSAALLNIKLQNGQDLIHNRKVTGFSNSEEDASGKTPHVPFMLEDALKQKGAHYISAPNYQTNVIQSGRLITGQNPASATSLANVVVKSLQ